MDLFTNNFGQLATGRFEMVQFRCRTHCKSAAERRTHRYVEMVTAEINRFGETHPGSILTVQSYYDFDSLEQRAVLDNPMMSLDKQSVLLRWMWSVPVELQDAAEDFVVHLERFMNEKINAREGEHGIEAKLTGHITLNHAMKMSIFEFPLHEMKTIWIPVLILGYVLRSPRLLLLALVPMVPELLVGIGLMYFVSLVLPVSYYGLLMMTMLIAALSWDYALFMLTRYKVERDLGRDVEEAIVTSIAHSGSLITVSAVVLTICWCTMLGMPGMFKSFALSAAIAIITSALSMVTLVPSLLAIHPWLGPPAAARPVANGEMRTLRSDGSASHSEDDEALRDAELFMKGPLFRLGAFLTQWPINVFLIVAVYTAMMPLTLRFCENFDLWTFTFTGMGHSYEMTMPRGQDEWLTAARIQDEFTNKEGVPMPIMILSHNKEAYLPPSASVAAPAPTPAPTAARGFFHRPHLWHRHSKEQESLGSFVSQGLIDADCHLMNSLITATRGKPYALDADSFVSPSAPREDSDTGGVTCMKLWQTQLVHYGTKWLAPQVNSILQELWNSTVTDRAALTFIFPKLDPFGPESFALVEEVRRVIDEEREMDSVLVPGLERTVFGPTTVVMDLTDMTSSQLPFCFGVCVVICFSLIACWFGAAIVPVKLLLTVIVPITWTYGAALFVYNDGALDHLGFEGLMRTGNAGLDWTVPVFSLTFLVGLALDYDFFLFERVYDFRKAAFGDRESIQLGLAATGGTITAAGMILGCTFVSQLFAVLPTMNQTGFVYVFSIVVDTFVVRTVVVPALLSLTPWVNYWPTEMPRPKYEWLSDADSPLSALDSEAAMRKRLTSGDASDSALE
eukprot:TRINITY_DN26371_c0_g1_i2.p1 TRINITY_DN26371_c0_g1~~TRINITY_DN26371_c0_g1_i2.p1  ORF type:complete len:850 (+),score=202.19 TRINITY_DN26371_c0_g1_i2:253-2802(+)